MRRNLLTRASVASLILCLVTALFWVRSYNLIWGTFYHSGRQTVSLVNHDGTIEIGWYNEWQTGLWGRVQTLEMRPKDAWIGAGGANELVMYLAFRSPQITIRYRVFAFAGLVLPVFWLVTKFRRAKAFRGRLCPTCRYDLRGNMSGVCPECGTRIGTSGAGDMDDAGAIEGIQRGLDDVAHGRTVPARVAFDEIRRKLKIPEKR